MNGFANTVLTLLLGWVRTLLNSAWSLLNSESGSALMEFMRANWLTLFIALCAGGFVVDRIVYLVRWRPYYVWQTRLERLRHGSRDERDAYDLPYPEAPAPEPLPEYDNDTVLPYPQGAPDPREGYAAPTATYAPQGYAPDGGYAPAAPTATYAPQGYAPDDGYAPAAPTATYAPQGYAPDDGYPPAAPTATYAPQGYAPDDGYAPAAPTATYAPQGYANPAEGLAPSFGNAQPEPVDYLRDVQAGFAPPIPPEELYPPEPDDPDGPVHPGLDIETFQQNIGLSQAELEAEEARRQVDFPDTTYVRYYDEAAKPAAKPKSGLSALAQRARSLVGDDDDTRSIRDLQPPVDIRQAFHAPVYPQKYNNKGEE